MKNDLLLRTLKREKTERTPVWVMRQAGRYLPEYRATRAKAGDFLSLCKNPELACEVTLQPLERFPLDAAILFSDILTIPDAMGLGLYFAEGEGPKFERTVRSQADFDKLLSPDPNTELRYVMDCVRTIRGALNGRVPLIGFAGSPWTLATYMVEGGGGHNFSIIKNMAYSEPELLDALVEKLAQSVANYLLAQVEAGAQVLQVFDTWGGILAPNLYQRFSLAPMARIVTKLKQYAPDVPVILFTKNGGIHFSEMADTGCDALGVDWTISLDTARNIVQDRVTLQGNIDPAILRASPEAIRKEVAAALASYGNGHGHIFNLGHGITPDVPPENLAVMVNAVHELSPQYHQ